MRGRRFHGLARKFLQHVSNFLLIRPQQGLDILHRRSGNVFISRILQSVQLLQIVVLPAKRCKCDVSKTLDREMTS